MDHAPPDAGPARQDGPVEASRRRRGRPSLSEAAAISDALIAAATELFLTNGFERTSMEMVSARAGVPRSTLYKRFSDKRMLLREVIATRVKRWSEINTKRNWALSNDLTQRLERYAIWICGWGTDPEVRAFTRLALDAWPDQADTSERLRILGQADLVDLIEQDIRIYATQPALIADPRRVAMTLLSMIAGWLSFRSVAEKMAEDEAAEMATYLVGILCDGRSGW